MELSEFYKNKEKNIQRQGEDKKLKQAGFDFLKETSQYNYTYNFTWMGVPIIQVPQDMIAMQEIIWEVKPDLIIETGIAHGGSLVYYASIMELIGHGTVLGIDIDIRDHNRERLENHPMIKRIKMIQGSAIDKETVAKVAEIAKDAKKIMVVLDSNHTHDHVLEELKLYSPFVSLNSYLVVFDTAVEDMPEGFYKTRPWGKGNNPKTAVWEFLKSNDSFSIDKTIDNKLIISVAPEGFLKRVK
jgi:cephalosporin hydroxylase